ncbi:hypothetical protein ACFQ2M_21425 [Kitasatospora saccharophila]|uniref:hypothetical protein n=1 Tax=Kitasatospora saccharophila TaxID=407973 RepID=UPI003630C193
MLAARARELLAGRGPEAAAQRSAIPAQSSAVSTVWCSASFDQVSSNTSGSTGETCSMVAISGLWVIASSTSSTIGLRSADAQPSSRLTPADSGAPTYANTRSALCIARKSDGTRGSGARPATVHASLWCALYTAAPLSSSVPRNVVSLVRLASVTTLSAGPVSRISGAARKTRARRPSARCSTWCSLMSTPGEWGQVAWSLCCGVVFRMLLSFGTVRSSPAEFMPLSRSSLDSYGE